MTVLRRVPVLGLSIVLSCAQAQPPTAASPATSAGAGAPPATAPPATASPATASTAATADPRFDAELSAYPYPFPVSFLALPSQQETVKMAYMDVAAEQPNGHTVVLLHGKNFSASCWGPTIRFLSARGYRVIAPDQIGFGKSSKPARYQYSFQQLAHNTNAVLDAA